MKFWCTLGVIALLALLSGLGAVWSTRVINRQCSAEELEHLREVGLL